MNKGEKNGEGEEKDKEDEKTAARQVIVFKRQGSGMRRSRLFSATSEWDLSFSLLPEGKSSHPPGLRIVLRHFSLSE